MTNAERQKVVLESANGLFALLKQQTLALCEPIATNAPFDLDSFLETCHAGDFSAEGTPAAALDSIERLSAPLCVLAKHDLPMVVSKLGLIKSELVEAVNRPAPIVAVRYVCAMVLRDVMGAGGSALPANVVMANISDAIRSLQATEKGGVALQRVNISLLNALTARHLPAVAQRLPSAINAVSEPLLSVLAECLDFATPADAEAVGAGFRLMVALLGTASRSSSRRPACRVAATMGAALVRACEPCPFADEAAAQYTLALRIKSPWALPAAAACMVLSGGDTIKFDQTIALINKARAKVNRGLALSIASAAALAPDLPAPERRRRAVLVIAAIHKAPQSPEITQVGRAVLVAMPDLAFIDLILPLLAGPKPDTALEILASAVLHAATTDEDDPPPDLPTAISRLTRSRADPTPVLLLPAAHAPALGTALWTVFAGIHAPALCRHLPFIFPVTTAGGIPDMVDRLLTLAANGPPTHPAGPALTRCLGLAESAARPGAAPALVYSQPNLLTGIGPALWPAAAKKLNEALPDPTRAAPLLNVLAACLAVPGAAPNTRAADALDAAILPWLLTTASPRAAEVLAAVQRAADPAAPRLADILGPYPLDPELARAVDLCPISMALGACAVFNMKHQANIPPATVSVYRLLLAALPLLWRDGKVGWALLHKPQAVTAAIYRESEIPTPPDQRVPLYTAILQTLRPILHGGRPDGVALMRAVHPADRLPVAVAVFEAIVRGTPASCLAPPVRFTETSPAAVLGLTQSTVDAIRRLADTMVRRPRRPHPAVDALTVLTDGLTTLSRLPPDTGDAGVTLRADRTSQLLAAVTVLVTSLVGPMWAHLRVSLVDALAAAAILSTDAHPVLPVDLMTVGRGLFHDSPQSALVIAVYTTRPGWTALMPPADPDLVIGLVPLLVRRFKNSLPILMETVWTLPTYLLTPAIAALADCRDPTTLPHLLTLATAMACAPDNSLATAGLDVMYSEDRRLRTDPAVSAKLDGISLPRAIPVAALAPLRASLMPSAVEAVVAELAAVGRPLTAPIALEAIAQAHAARPPSPLLPTLCEFGRIMLSGTPFRHIAPELRARLLDVTAEVPQAAALLRLCLADAGLALPALCLVRPTPVLYANLLAAIQPEVAGRVLDVLLPLVPPNENTHAEAAARLLGAAVQADRNATHRRLDRILLSATVGIVAGSAIGPRRTLAFLLQSYRDHPATASAVDTVLSGRKIDWRLVNAILQPPPTWTGLLIATARAVVDNTPALAAGLLDVFTTVAPVSQFVSEESCTALLTLLKVESDVVRRAALDAVGAVLSLAPAAQPAMLPPQAFWATLSVLEVGGLDRAASTVLLRLLTILQWPAVSSVLLAIAPDTQPGRWGCGLLPRAIRVHLADPRATTARTIIALGGVDADPDLFGPQPARGVAALVALLPDLLRSLEVPTQVVYGSLGPNQTQPTITPTHPSAAVGLTQLAADLAGRLDVPGVSLLAKLVRRYVVPGMFDPVEFVRDCRRPLTQLGRSGRAVAAEVLGLHVTHSADPRPALALLRTLLLPPGAACPPDLTPVLIKLAMGGPAQEAALSVLDVMAHAATQTQPDDDDDEEHCDTPAQCTPTVDLAMFGGLDDVDLLDVPLPDVGDDGDMDIHSDGDGEAGPIGAGIAFGVGEPEEESDLDWGSDTHTTHDDAPLTPLRADDSDDDWGTPEASPKTTTRGWATPAVGLGVTPLPR